MALSILILSWLIFAHSYGVLLNEYDDSVHYKISWNSFVERDKTRLYHFITCGCVWYLFILARTGLLKWLHLKSDRKAKFHLVWLVLKDISSDAITLRTNEQEVYHCTLPRYIAPESSESDNDDEDDESMSPQSLLQDILTDTDCLYLIEGYWTYELCHGLHLRQFHKDTTPSGEVTNVLEFKLGVFHDVQTKKDTPADVAPPTDTAPPIRHFNGKDYPYYEVIIGGGTSCDTRGDFKRITKLKYICVSRQGSLPTLIFVKETITCEYEALIATQQLCANRAYQEKTKPVYDITCNPDTSDIPRVPLQYQESQQLLDSLKQQSIEFDKLSADTSSITDQSYIKSFLARDYCLPGKSTGWWQNELCFEDSVRQVHKQNSITVQTIYLGYWDKTEHIKWFKKSGHNKRSANHVTHLYVNGDVCDITRQPRQCRVKYKCVKTGSPSQISLFLEEPTPCNYLMTVEGQFVCNLLKDINEYGIFNVKVL